MQMDQVLKFSMCKNVGAGNQLLHNIKLLEKNWRASERSLEPFLWPPRGGNEQR